MNIRKTAVLGGFALGAAVAFAPLASADDLTTVVDSEISSLNSIFTTEADLAGDGSAVIAPTDAQPFDTIPSMDAPLSGTGTLDSLLYGVDPLAAGPSPDPGAYDVFNGALVEFDDAFNVELNSLLNPGDVIPTDDLFGSATNIADGLASADPATYFFDFGLGDLSGFLQVDLASLF